MSAFQTYSRRLVRAKLSCQKGLIFALFVIIHSAGCTKSVFNQVAALNDAHIKQLTNLYNGYQRSHSWHGPKDEAALKQFVQHDMDPNKLALMNVDPTKLDEVFVSSRDHTHFKVKYGVGGGPGINVAVVFESSGVEGNRQVGFTGPIVEEVDEAHYKDLWSGKATATAETTRAQSAGSAANTVTGDSSKK
jgi:hypothetical protein